jgi:lipopolysaccharide export system permease protein
MKNTIYKYFFFEFIRNFTIILFSLTAVIWTIQAVNFLDLVTEDGHAFKVYLLYSFLIVTKMVTKLIPFSFLLATIFTISKLEKDNELIILWTSGLNKIHIVNLIFRISLVVMIGQLLMSNIVTPETLNKSRKLLKFSDLQFVPSLLKKKVFNDTVEGLTVFVEDRNIDGTYNNIFIRDDNNILTQIESSSSTIFAKSGMIDEINKQLILKNGNIQRTSQDGSINTIKFEITSLNLSGLSTKSITEPKVQETSTLDILLCLTDKNTSLRNCQNEDKEKKDIKIEINKRFGMPIFIPLIGLMSCFALSSRREKKLAKSNNYTFFGILCFVVLIISEITVRYSGLSLNHTLAYYLMPAALLPFIYILLIRTFKYENLK